jgi:hypothetical protein
MGRNLAGPASAGKTEAAVDGGFAAAQRWSSGKGELDAGHQPYRRF